MPAAGSFPGRLYGVAATSPSDAWAVGGTSWFKPSTLIEHWDGTAWTRVPSPTPGGGAQLAAVAATSADNAWAVGAVGPGPGIPPGPGTMALIVHWNGTAWK